MVTLPSSMPARVFSNPALSPQPPRQLALAPHPFLCFAPPKADLNPFAKEPIDRGSVKHFLHGAADVGIHPLQDASRAGARAVETVGRAAPEYYGVATGRQTFDQARSHVATADARATRRYKNEDVSRDRIRYDLQGTAYLHGETFGQLAAIVAAAVLGKKLLPRATPMSAIAQEAHKGTVIDVKGADKPPR
jgi:hypothetical protein